MRALTKEEWLRKFTAAHGARYSYEYVDWENIKSTEKVEITCGEHGVFKQQARHHGNGVGCPECGLKLIRDSKAFGAKIWAEKCLAVHRGVYAYPTYLWGEVKAGDTVPIICKKHGVFKQNLQAHHDKGTGCPLCVVGDQRYLYINKFENGFKFGITKNHKLRLYDQNRKNKTNMTSYLLFEFDDYLDCRACENALKLTTRPLLSKSDMVDGYTETFCENQLDVVIGVILEYGGVEIEH